MIHVFDVLQPLENKKLTMITECNFKRSISRVVIGKILSSPSMKWLKSDHYKKLSCSFLSEAPENEMYLIFIIKNASVSENSYGIEIMTLSIKWIDSIDEIIDPDGNVWISSSLKITPIICSNYGDRDENFSIRVECLREIVGLLGELKEFVPGPVRTMILDNDGRIAREEGNIHNKFCEELKSIISMGKFSNNLRIKGSTHTIPRELIEKKKIPSGRYIISYTHGPRSSPVTRKYAVTIPANPLYRVSIRRES